MNQQLFTFITELGEMGFNAKIDAGSMQISDVLDTIAIACARTGSSFDCIDLNNKKSLSIGEILTYYSAVKHSTRFREVLDLIPEKISSVFHQHQNFKYEPGPGIFCDEGFDDSFASNKESNCLRILGRIASFTSLRSRRNTTVVLNYNEENSWADKALYLVTRLNRYTEGGLVFVNPHLHERGGISDTVYYFGYEPQGRSALER